MTDASTEPVAEENLFTRASAPSIDFVGPRLGWRGRAESQQAMWGAPATPNPVPTVESHVQTITRSLAPLENRLWALALATAVLDVYLTATGLEAGFAEGNPVVAVLLDSVGIAALVGLKAAAFALAGLARRHRPVWGPWLSLGLAVPWGLAVCVNSSLFLLQ